MHLTFLGTGSAMPTGERHQSGLLVSGGDEPLLIDCGSGVIHRLARTEFGYEGVSTLLLTHHHLDHVADILPLLKARWLSGEDHMTIAGPEGTEDLVRDLLSVHDYMEGRIDLEFREVGPGSFSIAGYDVEAMEVRHSMYCQAYRLSIPGDGAGDSDPPSLTVSGDTEAFPELIEFADGSAILVHDCSFPDGVDVDNHPTPSSLGEALAAVDPDIGRVYLTHLYPHTDGKHDEMLASIRDHYDGEVRLASDERSLTVE